MRKPWSLAVLIVASPVPLLACLWDSDTLEAEARGLPDVVRILTGRFERNPALYYRMRLDRVAGKIASDPDDLGAYDDAGVACDRLGRDDEAIAWMERKAARLDALERSGARPAADLKEQRYRYLANLGTFSAHRWIRSGADPARLAELRTARDRIAEALRLNPDAHFGRERIQLKALEWLIVARGEALDQGPPAPLEEVLPGFLDLDDPANRASDPVRGLTGLVALGDAWESVDVFNTLAQALAKQEQSSVALLAQLRCEELIDAGRRSLGPGAPTDPEALKQAIRSAVRGAGRMMVREERQVRAAYAALRREADAWAKARTDFMTARLEQGRHPDTDPDFWAGYRDVPPPPIRTASLPGERSWLRVRPARVLVIVEAGAIAVTLVGAAGWWRRRRARRKPVSVAAEL